MESGYSPGTQNVFDPNDILVDQTMICEASRLFNDQKSEDFSDGSIRYLGILDHEPSEVERLLNLSMLLDALALHQNLYVLKAELPDDAEGLLLRNLLLKKGVVRELDTTPHMREISSDFRTFLSTIESLNAVKSLDDLLNFNKGERKVTPDSIENWKSLLVVEAVDRFISGGARSSTPMGSMDFTAYQVSEYLAKERGGRKQLFLLSKSDSIDLASRPFLAFGEQMLRDVQSLGSGDILRAVSQLRTFVYWRVSEHARIVFYPSCRRAPQIELLTGNLRVGIAEQVYHIVADAFAESVDLVFADETQVPLFLPPALAIFLEIYRDTEDLSETIDNFRDVFAKTRESLNELQNELVNASTLGERLSIKQRIVHSLKLIEAKFSMVNDSALDNVIGFAPEVLKPLSNPLDPTKYSKELLTKPAGWIKDWWRSRPLRHVFKLRERLHGITGYERLAGQALGIEFDKEEKEKFLQDYNRYLALYDRPG